VRRVARAAKAPPDLSLMLIYRDGGRDVPAGELLQALSACVRLSPDAVERELLLQALLRAGELECALADVASPAAETAASLTDALAERWLTEPHAVTPAIAALLKRLSRAALLNERQNPQVSGEKPAANLGHHLPGTVRISPPEGFAYYTLHPLAYADVVARQQHCPPMLGVIGIRSIGTTLSAVVAAAARARGAHAERITARPGGHPFDRRAQFTAQQRDWVTRLHRQGAEFYVVDEGPGLSGSSLLSLAEALEACGVTRERITLVCGHEPNLEQLCARDAALRWRRFRCLVAGHATHIPTDVAEDLGGGRWRQRLATVPDVACADWPASCVGFERSKFLSRDGKRLFKFEGLGHYSVEARARALHRAGFGPAVERAEHGFLAYEFLPAQPLHADKLDAAILQRLAQYCAFRARAFRQPDAASAAARLCEMLQVNARELLQVESSVQPPATAGVPVICDSRMQPHEWIRTADGRILNTDAASHGDDHFYPGPCDIAWDVAGAIVEWRMATDAANRFIHEFERMSGDRLEERLGFYLAAYAAFRAGFCRMGIQVSAGDGEEIARLERDAHYYERVLQDALSRSQRSAAA